jgi:amidohydrolase
MSDSGLDWRTCKVLRLALLFAGFMTAVNGPTPALAAPDFQESIQADYRTSLGALFDWLHRHPELSMQEGSTASRMATELRAIEGMAVTERVGGTGVVAVLKNGPGPTVLIRADMDGLPIEELSGLANASRVRQTGRDGVTYPVMHACGHDTHMTALVAAARQAAALRDRWRGTAIFVAQPAEEVGEGAKAMVADGLYRRFPKPDYALAFHVAAELPTGTLMASEATQYSSADAIDITVRGIATHGASPQLGKDPIYIASQLVVALQGLIGRERPPLDPGLITVGTFHAGTKRNIIADSADLQLILRANDVATRNLLLAAIQRTAAGIAAANGVPAELAPIVKLVTSAPPVVNETALARQLLAAFGKSFGPDRVKPWRQVDMGAEDFAYLIAPEHGVRGFYFLVGGTPDAALKAAATGGPPVAGHHSPRFKVAAEPAVTIGATAMVVAMLELMGVK